MAVGCCVSLVFVALPLVEVSCRTRDLNTLNTFWFLSEIIDHPKTEVLRENGICFTCSCPQFNHYYSCKHSVALALHLNKIKVPVRFSTQVVGKRKAPAGASLSRRGHCLVID